ncbi:DUF47 domain-containing protein [Companilactobacillus halodurans]|uniref:DUF47 family protein n=1 Tax=Companilactobacillus halodurans TaxID=2584183 RepID=A0A5P0ZMB0_9LACO|nr:DUF47 family protein [Companilactobacillus halodurans]MQS75338.1 DUF47 family protein [Companilactobacillus halodurans]MQS97415.1 DUF47 family protein [Companilactobacillus halodurans]
MIRKKKYDFFKAMQHLADDALKASGILTEIINNYDPAKFSQDCEMINKIESDGDEDVKKTMNELYVAFITPIDREDIVQLVDKLDNIIDGINGLTYEFYYLNIQELRPDTDKFMNLINEAVEAVQQSVAEFSHFKNSKMLVKNIDNTNRIESLGDELYTKHLRTLFCEEENDPLTVIRWQKIYGGFERVLDACEDCADVMGGLVIKNS